MRRLLSLFHRSIRGRLILLVVAVLLPATVLVGWLIYESYRHERSALERHLIGAARATSLLVDAALSERQALLEGLSTSNRLALGDLGGFRDQAGAVVQGLNEWIVLVDANGRQVVNTLLPSDAVLPEIVFKPELREAMEQRRPYVSNLTLGPASRRQMVFTAIPIFRGTDLRFTLNFEMTPDVFSESLTKGGAAPSWNVTIIDRDNIIFARTRRAEDFVGVKASERISEAIRTMGEGVIESTTLDGVESITAFTRSAKSGWTVVMASPAEELFSSAEKLLNVALWVSLVFGVGAGGVAWWASRGVVVAVRTLVSGTEAVGRGRVLRDGDTGIAETDIVFRALKETSERLAARDGDLVQANHSLSSAASALREKQERLDAARTAAATGTFVWHVAGDSFESDESLNTLLALDGPTLRSFGEFVALVHPDDRARVQDAMQRCAQEGADLAVEYRIVRPDRVTRWISTRGKATRGVGGAYVAAGCVDVTERRKSEADVARARDAAVAASRAKDEFLAALSHELRTPLNPVLLVASDAAQHPDYPPAAREAFAVIAKNAALEARLIDDLLDLTRVTQGKLLLDLKAVDAHAVLREAIATVRPELEQKYQVLNLELRATGSTVQGDPTRLQQVFWNVLKNAVKFTPTHGRIAVLSRVVEGEIEIEIADSGIGMTSEEIARSFKSFSQGDHAMGGSAHRFGGLGLGLAISRMLMELHGGRISVRSAGRGQGATFSMRLPLVDRPSGSEGVRSTSGGEPAVATGAGRGKKILLIEDHEATRITLTRLLTRRGYEAKSAACSAEGLRFAAEHKFDLVISDIGLPDADGYTLMKQLRDRYQLRGVALTGYGMEDDIERGRAAGFVEHLTKPVDMNKLAAVLARVMPNLDGNSDSESES